MNTPFDPAPQPIRLLWCALAAGLGVVASLLIWAPAAWLSRVVERVSDGQIILAQAQGTVWNGSAKLVLSAGENSRDPSVLPSPMNWRFKLGWPGLSVQFSTACCTSAPISIQFQPQWGGMAFTVKAQPSHWPANWLSGLGTPWNTLDLRGKLVLAIPQLHLRWVEGRWVIQGQAHLQALNMTSRLSTLSPVGSYTLDLTSNGTLPAFDLHTEAGPLMLSGQGQWVGGQLRFSGQAWAQPGFEAALANVLNVIGRRRGDRSLLSVG